ncbi:MAG TPA: FAD:protein FMN transferase, partial [Firmicutes bacterium]|nr:FAD:protein FMN transferase [Bacillota bacterium]
YIIDRAAEALKKDGIKKAYINGGGDIRVLGTRTDGKPWRIGIRHPRSDAADAVIAVIELTDGAVVTSGDYQRFFMAEGKRYHHILDPFTGYPAEGEVISVSVIAEKAVVADMLATGVMVMGLDKGLPLIESLPGVDAIIITSDLEVHATSGIKDRVEQVP